MAAKAKPAAIEHASCGVTPRQKWTVYGRWQVWEEVLRQASAGRKRNICSKDCLISVVSWNKATSPRLHVKFQMSNQISVPFAAFLAGCIVKLRQGKAAVRADVIDLLWIIAKELMGYDSPYRSGNTILVNIKQVGQLMKIGADELVRRSREDHLP